MMTIESIIVPDWPAPDSVRAVSTTRIGGQSVAPYDSFNLAQHVKDEDESVLANRDILKKIAGFDAEPTWLEQVHGNKVIDASQHPVDAKADASFATNDGVICSVMTADCLPVLFCDRQGQAVAAAHAGWRGLADGVLEATLQRLCDELACSASQILAWLGPAIGPEAFEVGSEVRDAFLAQHDVEFAFVETRAGHWLMDLSAIARYRLSKAGVTSISGGGYCTYTDEKRFFSYRRDGRCGRMASLIWLQNASPA